VLTGLRFVERGEAYGLRGACLSPSDPPVNYREWRRLLHRLITLFGGVPQPGHWPMRNVDIEGTDVRYSYRKFYYSYRRSVCGFFISLHLSRPPIGLIAGGLRSMGMFECIYGTASRCSNTTSRD